MGSRKQHLKVDGNYKCIIETSLLIIFGILIIIGVNINSAVNASDLLSESSKITDMINDSSSVTKESSINLTSQLEAKSADGTISGTWGGCNWSFKPTGDNLYTLGRL
ncbi:hypothetical protein KOM07_11860 [Lentilactobacillus sp. G22-6]|uniref:hypothetical protein n=1 Tax=Lentilactobacillus dabitei TaxID=2831523 RepID=UPI001C2658A5|nr:hypothetical protein [Lentilactobacillus dabitei]MBU9790210.1 hypothetical protein [Lentilactobacillus dabitei]